MGWMGRSVGGSARLAPVSGSCVVDGSGLLVDYISV